jgi:hypothetical protein
MPPLFPYQAVVPRPQADRLGEYVPQSSAPPYNEILDSLLTGYLWGCLLVALFLVIYFAISFCVWTIGTALTTIDMVIDCIGSRGSVPDAGTDNAMMAWPLPDKYNTLYLEHMTLRSEVDNPTWSRDKSDKDLWDVLSSTERSTLLKEKGVKDCLDRCQRSEPIEHSIQHLPFYSENTNAVEATPNTAYALMPTDQYVVSVHD